MRRTGRCLCGAIRFETDQEFGPVTACHRGRGRRQAGNHAAATPPPTEALTVTGAPRWYAASPRTWRGSRETWGSHLSWEEGDGLTYVAAAFYGSKGLRLDGAIFAADKGHRADIADGLSAWADGSRT